MRQWVDQARPTQVIRGLGGGNINGGDGGYSRRFWWALGEGGKGMWILNQGLVEKEDEEMEEGVGLTKM
jgi:hypothetical protein